MKLNFQANTQWLWVVALLMLTQIVFAQKTVVTGTVTDAETNQPLPFVNISFYNSKIGTTTDFNGKYALETFYATDSIVASSVGYLRMAHKVVKDKAQVINFKLAPSSVQLNEVVIKADKKAENPAHAIIKAAIDNKKINNREKLDSYQYEVYTKLEFDINNLSEEFQNRKVMKPFKFVFDNVDSTSEKPSLPFFMSESISEFFYKKFPKSEKEIITATRVSGLDNNSVSQLTGDMYQNLNFYENYVSAYGKTFVSPLADFGLFTYQYYLVDSANIDGYWCYKIKFQPKREFELTFDGEIWIADTTYAIKQLDCDVSGDANINFVKDFAVHQEHQQVQKEVWMITKDYLLVDFNLAEKKMGFYGKKTTTYRNFKINEPKADEFYAGLDNVIVDSEAGNKSVEYWEKSRHIELSEKEAQIYAMVDTLKKVPIFRTYVDIVTMFLNGYKVVGNFEIGPYYTFYSFNKIEGPRFRFGGRTSNAFSTKWMPEAYLAYGLTDQKFKYGGGFQYFITKQPRQLVGMYYKKDVELLGQSNNAFRNDNILASVFRRNQANSLNGFEEINAWYSYEWFQGLSNKVTFQNRRLFEIGDIYGLRFNKKLDDGNVVKAGDVTSTEVIFNTRFAYKEKYLAGEFERISLGTDYPTFNFTYTFGMKGVLNSGYQYHKAVLSIEDKLVLNSFGYMTILGEVGKIWGDAPFPLLKLHNGNATYVYDPYAFNMMNFYEFVSDEWLNLFVTHHFNGLFLNKIPLMRRLHWRETARFALAAGGLKDSNREILEFPTGLSGLNFPYMEAGVGIENIFKVLRVDMFWRMSYLDNPGASPIGFRAAFQIIF